MKNKQFNIKISDEDREMISQAVAKRESEIKTELSASALIRWLINEYLERS
jgi:hypothetical protein